MSLYNNFPLKMYTKTQKTNRKFLPDFSYTFLMGSMGCSESLLLSFFASKFYTQAPLGAYGLFVEKQKKPANHLSQIEKSFTGSFTLYFLQVVLS